MAGSRASRREFPAVVVAGSRSERTLDAVEHARKLANVRASASLQSRNSARRLSQRSLARSASTTPSRALLRVALRQKNKLNEPPNLAHVVLAAHLRPRDVVAPSAAFGRRSSRCRSRKIEAGTSRPRDRWRLGRQPEVRQYGYDNVALRDVGHNCPPATARAGQNVDQMNAP